MSPHAWFISCLGFSLLLNCSRIPGGFLLSQSRVIPRFTLALRTPWNYFWWPQGVTVGSHQESSAGHGGWWPQKTWVRVERGLLPLATFSWGWASLSFPEAHLSGFIILVPNPSVLQVMAAPAHWVPRGLCAYPSLSGVPVVLSQGSGSLPVPQRFDFPHLPDKSSWLPSPQPYTNSPPPPRCLKWDRPFLKEAFQSPYRRQQ